MTTHATAHVYYKDKGRTPDFILVVRDTQPVPMQLADVKIVETGDDHLAIVTRALAEIGWLPAEPSDARIVRQSDGLGHLPVVTTVDVDSPQPVDAHISVGGNGILGRVKVGDATKAMPPRMVWPQHETPDRVAARAVIDRALIDLGYIRTGPIRPAVDGLTTTVEPAEWRDHPTLVRVTDFAADVLGRAAMTLGIPADVLASTYIANAAADALRKHQWFSAPGTITDKRRIAGWLPDGSPDLINTASLPVGLRLSGGSGA